MMGLERRGCVVRPWPLANWKREEPVGEAKPFNATAEHREPMLFLRRIGAVGSPDRAPYPPNRAVVGAGPERPHSSGIPALPQAGEISGLKQRTGLRHPEISVGLHLGDARKGTSPP